MAVRGNAGLGERWCLTKWVNVDNLVQGALGGVALNRLPSKGRDV